MRATRILAVDLGAGHVASGIFGVGATGRLVLQRFAQERLDADPAHEGRWTEHTAQALGALAGREKLAGACSLAVPGHLALTKFIKTPALDPAKRKQSLAFEASQHIPYPLGEVVWDHVIIADDSFDLEVMLAAVKVDALEALCAAVDAAGSAAVQLLAPSGSRGEGLGGGGAARQRIHTHHCVDVAAVGERGQDGRVEHSAGGRRLPRRRRFGLQRRPFGRRRPRPAGCNPASSPRPRGRRCASWRCACGSLSWRGKCLRNSGARGTR